jgi:hypothetical protein
VFQRSGQEARRHFGDDRTQTHAPLGDGPPSADTISGIIIRSLKVSQTRAMAAHVFDLERVLRYSRRLVENNPRSVPGLQGLTLVAVERGDMDTAARHFSTLANQAPEPDHASEGSEDIIEYRLSQKAIDYFRDFMRTRPASPAERRY